MEKKTKITQEQFREKIDEFNQEPRNSIYDRCKKLIEKGFKVDGSIYLLSIWNVAWFSNVLKGGRFSYEGIEKSLKEVKKNLENIQEKGNNKGIKDVDLDKIEEEIKKIYDTLSKNNNIKYVGASKIMMLLNDKLFVAWDTKIQKNYKKEFKNNKFDYFNFLKLMQKKFCHLKIVNRTYGFAKYIDEYNYMAYSFNKK